MDPAPSLKERLASAHAAIERHKTEPKYGTDPARRYIAIARLEGKVAAYKEALVLLEAA